MNSDLRQLAAQDARIAELERLLSEEIYARQALEARLKQARLDAAAVDLTDKEAADILTEAERIYNYEDSMDDAYLLFCDVALKEARARKQLAFIMQNAR